MFEDYLFKRAETDKNYNHLIETLERNPNQPLTVAGPPDSHKSWLTLAIADKLKQIPCCLVPDELRARAVAADLKALTGKTVLIFRPRELNLNDAEAVSREHERQRLAVLAQLGHGDLGALVIPAAAAMQKLMPVKLFHDNCLLLKVGQTYDIDQLSEKLLGMGYERMRQVDEAGQFARRGDIIDIVPESAGDEQDVFGIRISFFDLEIDAIKYFDLDSQRSDQMCQQVFIPPAHELMISEQDQYRLAQDIEKLDNSAPVQISDDGTVSQDSSLRQLLRRDRDRLTDHILFAGLDRWLHRVYPQAASVIDYVSAAGMRLFVDEPLRLRHRLDASQAELDERIKMMMEKGQVHPESAQVAFRGIDISRKIEQFPGVIALCQIEAAGNELAGSRSISIQGRQAESYRGREHILIKQLTEWKKQAGEAILFAGSESRQNRLRDLLQENHLDLPVMAASLSEGFIWPAAGLMVVGSRDIFGGERTRRRRQHKSGLKIDLFSDLVPGELVVHEAHGVGRYEGLVNLETNGTRRDYLHIRYNGDDSLYLPMESLDQIQKYVGADGRKPRLSKLGGQEWNRLKERARDSIRKLATDLVKLYAQRMTVKGYRFAEDTVWQQEFEDSFPYDETADQVRTICEIKADMESDKVMDRLLCGDVGFGKTEVAFRAVFKCVMEGKQAVFLAPTTVLAQQHYENFKKRAADFPIEIGLLSRFAAERLQKKTLSGLRQGKIDVLIGTHRILSKDVIIKNMGLLVIDEEQRFGVDHKERIKELSPGVDVLTLTATPIPRTLHMAMAGIRDISVLEEPPHDRRPVQTYVMEYDEELVVEAMLREISRNGQVFYLYNDTRRIIEKSRALERLLPGARIIYAHGKMGSRRLEDIINDFISHEADILVCTTIIESGIDMPNVNTIIVEHADHFGLAQLYQLRGRVGRADRQAYAYVTYHRDKVLTEVAEKRLTAIRDFTELGSGFKIALRDLEVRGAGNLLGAEQHGHLEAIGYDLYCRMLEDTIKEIQGETQPVKIHAVLDLEVDAYLPGRYIPDEGQRMDMYRKVADIESLASHQDVLDEWLDRYGEPPKQALALAAIAYIRSAAGRFGFSRVEQQNKNIKLTYSPSAEPDMAALSKLLSHEKFKGMLLFNAGTRPYLIFRQAAARRDAMIGQLFELFQRLEKS